MIEAGTFLILSDFRVFHSEVLNVRRRDIYIDFSVSNSIIMDLL